MTNTNHADEFFDEELQSIGVVFTDETIPAQMPMMESTPRPKEAEKPKGAASKEECPPTPKYAPSYMDRIAGCVKWMIPCGGIAMLLWWFEINGLMDMIAAYPCILACGIVGAFGTGMNVKK